MALRELRGVSPARRHTVSSEDADLPETLGRARMESGTRLLSSTEQDEPWLLPASDAPTARPPRRPDPQRAGQPPLSGADRRASVRRVCALEVEFTDDLQFYRGVSQNLSAGGVFVRTRVVLPVSTPLALRFELPDGATVDAHAIVRWLCEPTEGGRQAGLGLQFTAFSRGALERIIGFCGRGAR